MASLFNNGYAADYARRLPQGDGGERLASFLWQPFAAVKPAPLESLPPARAFRDIGMVFMHANLARADENVRLEFRSSPYGSSGHSHSDQNSFHVIAFNEPLLLDTGYYTSAGDRHHAGWTRQTKAHNTILVDGLGQGRGDGRHLTVSAPPAPALRYVAVIQVGKPGFAPLEVAAAEAGARVGRWTVRLANGRLQVK